MALHRSSGFDPKNLLSDHVNERDTASRVCVVSDSHGIYDKNSYYTAVRHYKARYRTISASLSH